MNGELFWCHGGKKLPTGLPIRGNTDGLFFLASFEDRNPKLQLVPLNKTHATVTSNSVHCLYSNATLKQCQDGKRKKELTALQKLMKKYDAL